MHCCASIPLLKLNKQWVTTRQQLVRVTFQGVVHRVVQIIRLRDRTNYLFDENSRLIVTGGGLFFFTNAKIKLCPKQHLGVNYSVFFWNEVGDTFWPKMLVTGGRRCGFDFSHPLTELREKTAPTARNRAGPNLLSIGMVAVGENIFGQNGLTMVIWKI